MDKSLDGQIKGLQYKLIFPIENHMIERSHVSYKRRNPVRIVLTMMMMMMIKKYTPTIERRNECI